MKKLLFVLVFAFIGQQAFSQMYIVQISNVSSDHPQNCSWASYDIDISKIPAGKYLLTMVNGKTYTTPQKLIIL